MIRMVTVTEARKATELSVKEAQLLRGTNFGTLVGSDPPPKAAELAERVLSSWKTMTDADWDQVREQLKAGGTSVVMNFWAKVTASPFEDMERAKRIHARVFDLVMDIVPDVIAQQPAAEARAREILKAEAAAKG